MHFSRASTVSGAWFCLALAAGGLAGQEEGRVGGAVVGQDGHTPLAGVLVSLVGSSGTVASILTDAGGRFAFRAGTGQSLRLRAERVGLANAETPSFELGDTKRDLLIVMRQQPIELLGLNVESPVRECTLDERSALLVQGWWDEARKALEAAAWVHRERFEQHRFELFRREWSADLRSIRAEETLPADSTLRSPFRSPDARFLIQRGFVQGDQGSRRFFGPDPAVLVSPEFLASHCFEPVRAEQDGLLGLRIRPAFESELPDISGVLTVDTVSGRLESLDFSYEGLPDDLSIARAAGGRLEFEYLENGEWIVAEWWIRMPWIDSRVWPRRVLAYVDEGGRVVDRPDAGPEGPSASAHDEIALVDAARPEGSVVAPPAFRLAPIEVSVSNERVIDLLNLSLGVDPRSVLGFRLIEGGRLEQAKRDARMSATETLRWLFIPVTHALGCVYVNMDPPAGPGGAAIGEEPFCGNVFVDEGWVANEDLESIEMDDVVAITALPGEVRMFTRAFLRGG